MREHRYSVYVMSSRSGVLYIGATSELQVRVREHKNGAFPGFSKKYKCYRLVYYETYPYIQTAIRREKQLKGWTRAKKIALIEATNPRWEDLSQWWGCQFLVAGQSMKEADEMRTRRIVLQADGSAPKSETSGK